MTNIPEGRGSPLAGALESGSPLEAAREVTPGGAAPGRVVHCKREPFDVYIGRAGGRRTGAFGNPFTFDSETDRHEAIARFEVYARKKIAFDPAFRDAVKALHGKTLGCWCAPKACHGDVLLRLAAELFHTDIRQK